MIRYFCDYCEKEIDNNNRIDGDRLKTEITSRQNFMTVEVVTSTADMAKDCHFCKYCVIEAVNRLDDRPKPAYAKGL